MKIYRGRINAVHPSCRTTATSRSRPLVRLVNCERARFAVDESARVLEGWVKQDLRRAWTRFCFDSSVIAGVILLITFLARDYVFMFRPFFL